MINMKKIGDFIIEERKKKQLTQDELASMLYVTRQAVSKWERGVALPNYESLEKMCEIFDVTPNEILAGERKQKENIDYVDNIMIDVLKDNRKRIKKIIRFASSIILLLISIFLIYYFISTYNQFRIYTINGENDKFYMIDTLAVFSNEKAYIKFGGLRASDYKIKNIEYYYIKNGDRKIIYSSEDGNGLIVQNKNYDEFFDFKDIELISNSLLLDITYLENNEEKVSTINLNFKRVYANDNIVFDKDKVVFSEKFDNEEIKNNNIPKNIKENFTLNADNEYVLIYEKNKKSIKIIFNPQFNSFTVIEETKNSLEEFYYWKEATGERYSYYIGDSKKVISSSNLNNNTISCTHGDCSKHQKKYDYFIKNYINKYYQ